MRIVWSQLFSKPNLMTLAWIRDGISIHKDIEDYQEFIYDEQY